MIFFFNKKTGEIVGFIEGRIHPQDVIDNVKISMTGTSDDDIGKFVVPMKPVFEEVIVEKKGKRKKEKRVKELLPDVPFAKKIFEFEKDLSKIRDHKVNLDGEGRIVGFVKRK